MFACILVCFYFNFYTTYFKLFCLWHLHLLHFLVLFLSVWPCKLSLFFLLSLVLFCYFKTVTDYCNKRWVMLPPHISGTSGGFDPVSNITNISILPGTPGAPGGPGRPGRQGLSGLFPALPRDGLSLLLARPGTYKYREERLCRIHTETRCMVPHILTLWLPLLFVVWSSLIWFNCSSKSTCYLVWWLCVAQPQFNL